MTEIKLTPLKAAITHIENYARWVGVRPVQLMEDYLDGKLTGIRSEAIVRIIARYDGVTVSGVYFAMVDIEE